MFSTLRNRFGIPGVISVIALVFAMFGGAYAASNHGGSSKATASAKAKKGPKGPKGATGPAGSAGPAGPAGPAGAKGADGGAGVAGAAGSTGPTGPTGSAGAHGATGATGPDGEPWTAGGTLPVGSTETGTWSFFSTPWEAVITFYRAPISFTIPLAGPLDESHVHYSTEASFGTNCEGSAEEPTAKSGELCVYQAKNSGAEFQRIEPPSSPGSKGAGTAGAYVVLSQETEGEVWEARGAWAVTG